MADIGRVLVLAGTALILIGGAIWMLARVGFRGLPGDIHIQTESSRFYFPIVTCLVLSTLLTLAAWAWQWLARRP